MTQLDTEIPIFYQYLHHLLADKRCFLWNIVINHQKNSIHDWLCIKSKGLLQVLWEASEASLMKRILKNTKLLELNDYGIIDKSTSLRLRPHS